MKLFNIKGLEFNSEDFLDELIEFEDIIPIIKDLEETLNYEEIECVGENDCCNNTNKNYIVEIQGFINNEDEFLTKEEVINSKSDISREQLDMFVIRIYKCVDCGKWIIDILE